MFWFSLLICVSVIQCELENFSETKFKKIIHNSSDLSNESAVYNFYVNESDFRISKDPGSADNISVLQSFSRLYDHHNWSSNIISVNVSQCRDDMSSYMQELPRMTSWATKSELLFRFAKFNSKRWCFHLC